MPVVYQPHPLHWDVQLRMLELSVGKGHQVIITALLQYYTTVAIERAGYVLYRALVIVMAIPH